MSNLLKIRQITEISPKIMAKLLNVTVHTYNAYDQLAMIIDDLGILVDKNGIFTDIDSITFITLIIRIEETLKISFPDDLLVMNLIDSIDKLETVITNLTSEEK